MDLQTLERFFFWSMVVNVGIYMITAIAVVALRDFVYKVQKKLFCLDDEAVTKATLNYLGNFKLLITFFVTSHYSQVSLRNNRLPFISKALLK